MEGGEHHGGGVRRTELVLVAHDGCDQVPRHPLASRMSPLRYKEMAMPADPPLDIRIRPATLEDREFLHRIAPRLLVGYASWRDQERMLKTVDGFLQGDLEAPADRGMMVIAERADGTRLGVAGVAHNVNFTGERQAYLGELASDASSSRRWSAGRGTTDTTSWCWTPARPTSGRGLSTSTWDTGKRACVWRSSWGRRRDRDTRPDAPAAGPGRAPGRRAQVPGLRLPTMPDWRRVPDRRRLPLGLLQGRGQVRRILVEALGEVMEGGAHFPALVPPPGLVQDLILVNRVIQARDEAVHLDVIGGCHLTPPAGSQHPACRPSYPAASNTPYSRTKSRSRVL